jgi:hypothetical protein
MQSTPPLILVRILDYYNGTFCVKASVIP